MDYDDRNIGPSRPGAGPRKDRRASAASKSTADATAAQGPDRHLSRNMGAGAVGNAVSGYEIGEDGLPVAVEGGRRSQASGLQQSQGPTAAENGYGERPRRGY